MTAYVLLIFKPLFFFKLEIEYCTFDLSTEKQTHPNIFPKQHRRKIRIPLKERKKQTKLNRQAHDVSLGSGVHIFKRKKYKRHEM